VTIPSTATSLSESVDTQEDTIKARQRGKYNEKRKAQKNRKREAAAKDADEQEGALEILSHLAKSTTKSKDEEIKEKADHNTEELGDRVITDASVVNCFTYVEERNEFEYEPRILLQFAGSQKDEGPEKCDSGNESFSSDTESGECPEMIRYMNEEDKIRAMEEARKQGRSTWDLKYIEG
jgi:hypothetical protein